jgi:hypothetical protein
MFKYGEASDDINDNKKTKKSVGDKKGNEICFLF